MAASHEASALVAPAAVTWDGARSPLREVAECGGRAQASDAAGRSPGVIAAAGAPGDRERSRSPRRLPGGSSSGAAVSYRTLRPQDWSIKCTRDAKLNPRFNIYGPIVNLHPLTQGDHLSEPWSEMPFSLRMEYDGKPLERFKFSFRVSPSQAEWVENVVDAWCIDELTRISPDWNAGGKALKRDQVQSMYRSCLRREEGREPLMTMEYSTKGPERFRTVIHYFDALEPEGWSREPRKGVTGDAGLMELLGDHKLQRAKVRVEARFAGASIVNRIIYTKWEMTKVFMKAPPFQAGVSKMAPSSDEVDQMFGVE